MAQQRRRSIEALDRMRMRHENFVDENQRRIKDMNARAVTPIVASAAPRNDLIDELRSENEKLMLEIQNERERIQRAEVERERQAQALREAEIAAEQQAEIDLLQEQRALLKQKLDQERERLAMMRENKLSGPPAVEMHNELRYARLKELRELNERVMPTGDVKMRELLRSSGLILSQPLELVEDKPSNMVYSWATNVLFGTAVVRPVNSANAFDVQVQAYLDETQARCPGDFAKVADDTQRVAGSDLISFELACVSDDVKSSASVLFALIDNVFYTIAHETAPENFREAMRARDSVLNQIKRSVRG